MTLVGRVHVRPAGVDVDTDKETVPVRPFSAVAVMVEVPEAPARSVRLVGLAEMEKS